MAGQCVNLILIATLVCGGTPTTSGTAAPPSNAARPDASTGAVACVALDDATGAVFRYIVVTIAITPNDSVTVRLYEKWWESESARRFSSGRAGKLVWGNIQPGNYRLRAMYPGYEGILATVDVVAGETTNVSLRLKKPGHTMEWTHRVSRSDSGK